MLSGLPQRVVAEIATIAHLDRQQVESDSDKYLQACLIYLHRMCASTKYENNGIRASCTITFANNNRTFVVYSNSRESTAQKVLESAITCVMAGFQEVGK